MIEAYTGYPGAGKTFALTNRAYKSLKAKRKVFTSFPVKGTYKVTYDDLVNYSFPENSVVIIDESGRWFNSRNWGNLPPQVFDLFTLHRHARLDLIIGVQNFNRIDVALREVIELVWWARNHWWLPVFVYDGYYDVEQLGLKGEANLRSYVWKWSRSRKLYDTHAMKSIFDGIPTIPLITWGTEGDSEERIGSAEADRNAMDDEVIINGGVGGLDSPLTLQLARRVRMVYDRTFGAISRRIKFRA